MYIPWIIFTVCPNPPTIFDGTPENIIGNPPYEYKEIITYTCATNYTLYGLDENMCGGPPDYNWDTNGIWFAILSQK